MPIRGTRCLTIWCGNACDTRREERLLFDADQRSGHGNRALLPPLMQMLEAR